MTDNTGSSGGITFEQAYRRLEEIARRLEQDTTPLEESFALFDEGQKLLKVCQGMLDQAERRIKMLEIEDGGVTIKDADIGES